MTLTRHSMRIAGILLLTIVAVETGGLYLIGASSGAGELTDFQLNFSRAGHAHAGMLVTLSLVVLVWADAAGLHGPAGWVARLGVPAAAILMSVGFFLSSAGSGRTEPNPLIALVWLGGLCLAAGVVTLGISLLRAGLAREPADRG
jgi:hypothetical protein